MRIAVTLIGVLVLAGVVGCTPEPPPVLPAPEASAAPLFASEEEALAAAEEAYGRYLAVSDRVAEGGGIETELFDPLATEAMREKLNTSAAHYANKGIHTVGASSFDSMALQQYFVDESGGTTLIVYLCVDVSEVSVVDDAGALVTPVERDDRIPLEVEMVTESEESLDLLLARSDVWSGDDFCG